MKSRASSRTIATIGIDIGKNTFHLIGLDQRGAIGLRQKMSRGQVVVRLANMPPCLVGMEAWRRAHHLSRQLLALGHDVKLVPGQFVKPFLKGQKNDFRDAEAVAEAVQRGNGAGECLVDDVCRPQARNLSFPSRGALNVPRHSGRLRGCAWNIFRLQCLNR